MDNFGKFFSPPYALDLTKRERQEMWYRNARYFIMASVLLTGLCTVLSLLGHHPFHLTLAIPHALILWGYLSSGQAPTSVYESYVESGFEVPVSNDSTLMFATTAALFVLLLFIVCWYRSKDYHVGWIITALVLMLVDTAAMLVIYGFSPFGLVFHAGVITLQIIGIRAHFKLKKTPPDYPDLIPLDKLK